MNAEPDEIDDESPEEAAVFPEIPEELGVHPLTLATLHALVFLGGSDPSVVRPDSASEIVDQVVLYLRRLKGADLRRIQEDFECLSVYARSEKWPKVKVQFLKSFLAEVGLGKS